MGELEEGRSVAVAVDTAVSVSVTYGIALAAVVALAVAVALLVALAVAVGFIGFGVTICTRQEIMWSPVCLTFCMNTRVSLYILLHICSGLGHKVGDM